MSRRKASPGLFVAALLFVLAGPVNTAPAALLFYDGFEQFPTGGWTQGGAYGEWTVNVPGVGVAAKTLSYIDGDVWVHGGANALQFGAGANHIGGAALVANFGGQTGTIYFSFLATVNDVVHDGQGPWLQPMLSPNASGTSHQASVIVNAGPSTYFGGSGGETAARIFGTTSETKLLDDYAAGDTVFVVGRLEKSNPAGNYDRLSVALNPTTLIEPASWTATVSHDLGANSVEYIRFRTDQISGGELAWIDAIRIGTSYGAVVPGGTDGTWTATQDGDWSDSANWQGGIPAHGPSYTATFNADLPMGETIVRLDSDRTIGNLVFGNTDPSTAGGWALLQGVLTLETTAPEVPTVTVHPLGDGAAVRIRSILAGTQGLTKAGEGTLVLTPPDNDYGDTTDIQAGTLQIGNNEPSVFVGTANHQYTVAEGARLVFNRNRDETDFTTQSITGAGDVVFHGQADGFFRFRDDYGGTLDYSGKTIVDLDAAAEWYQGSLWLLKENVLPDTSVVDLRRGKLVLQNQTNAGLTVAGLEGNAGTFLAARNPGQKLMIDVAQDATWTYAGTVGRDPDAGADQSYDGIVLTKTGLGTQVLAGENTYTGPTVIEAGTLQIGDGTGSYLGSAGHHYTVKSGAQLVFHRNQFETDFTTQSIVGEGDVVFRGQEDGFFRFQNYTGTLDYTGKTIVDLDTGSDWSRGTLWLEKDNVLPHATVVDLQRGKVYLRNQTDNGLTIAGLEGNAGTFLVPRADEPIQKLTIDVAEGSTYTYAGTLGSDGSDGGGTNLVLMKKGPGTQVLAGHHNYTGGTFVSGGTLDVTGSLADGDALIVQHGGTLAGTGTIHSTVSILAGGALAPGSSEDGLDLSGNLAFEPGAFFDVEIDSSGGAGRVRMAGGTLSPGNATIRVSLLDDFDPDAGSSWTILSGEGNIDGAFMPTILVDGPAFLAAGKWLEVSYLDSVVLTSVVPEPATFVMAAMALAMLLWRRKR